MSQLGAVIQGGLIAGMYSILGRLLVSTTHVDYCYVLSHYSHFHTHIYRIHYIHVYRVCICIHILHGGTDQYTVVHVCRYVFEDMRINLHDVCVCHLKF